MTGIVASAGGTSSKPVVVHRPSWKDMKASYPPDGQDRYVFYPKISKALAKDADEPAYANTCALRMSYALNHSGVKLKPAPSKGGNLKGDDKLNYWLRVKDLAAELNRLFKAPDLTLTYPTPMPKPGGTARTAETYVQQHPTEYLARQKLAQDTLLSKISNKNGIVVFNVTGWSDATGHFTLWEGATQNLLYVGANTAEKNPTSPEYYFWLVKPSDDGKKLVETTSVSFWELK
ncbi:MAG TPA: type VI secretion system amidase effector protein Tae4 [Archangium sp.]|uniref:type VI secretion system amidase effector protein Tae4 n=1 Tax=Archangium sp. TaxID=1872627 RepID=UPI002E37B9EE|nr:type VI secretion system amidase effector protein Tae4 [Archangium sp.]HEX5752995.1 type VI secretion system amidase effector protein Tae4 [Archangium sp.]